MPAAPVPAGGGRRAGSGHMPSSRRADSTLVMVSSRSPGRPSSSAPPSWSRGRLIRTTTIAAVMTASNVTVRRNAPACSMRRMASIREFLTSVHDAVVVEVAVVHGQLPPPVPHGVGAAEDHQRSAQQAGVLRQPPQTVDRAWSGQRRGGGDHEDDHTHPEPVCDIGGDARRHGPVHRHRRDRQERADRARQGGEGVDRSVRHHPCRSP